MVGGTRNRHGAGQTEKAGVDAHKWRMMGHPPWTTVGNSKRGEHARPPRDELQGLQLPEKTPEHQRLLHRVLAKSASGLWGGVVHRGQVPLVSAIPGP